MRRSKTNKLTVISLTASLPGHLPSPEKSQSPVPKAKGHCTSSFWTDSGPQPPRGESTFNLTAATQICVSIETQVLYYSPHGLELWFIVNHLPFSLSLPPISSHQSIFLLPNLHIFVADFIQSDQGYTLGSEWPQPHRQNVRGKVMVTEVSLMENTAPLFHIQLLKCTLQSINSKKKKKRPNKHRVLYHT